MIGSIENEFIGVALGDKRRVARAIKIAQQLSSAPMGTLPEVFRNATELAGAYRLLNNKHVGVEQLSSVHKRKHGQRTMNAYWFSMIRAK